MGKSVLLVLIVALASCQSVSSRSTGRPAEGNNATPKTRLQANVGYPGAHWETRSPRDVGLDEGALNRLSQFMQGRGCIVRHGYLVYSWGDCAKRGDVASAAKPIYTYFLFKALEDGKLSSIDTKVSEYLPELAQLNPSLGFKDGNITFRHLATQTSCYGVRETPGTAFDYNDWQMALFVETLFLNVLGATYPTMDERVLRPMLSDVIRCEDSPTLTAFGADHRAGRVAISPRDFCRFGYLFLHDGRWEDTQLLSPQHARFCVTHPLPGTFPRTRAEAAEMRVGQDTLGSTRKPDDQCDHEGSYSWLWWVNGVNRNGRRHWPSAPRDVYAALGHKNGMRGMAVVPGLDIVMSWNDTALGEMEGDPGPLDTVFGLLRESVIGAAATGQMPRGMPLPASKRDSDPK